MYPPHRPPAALAKAAPLSARPWGHLQARGGSSFLGGAPGLAPPAPAPAARRRGCRAPLLRVRAAKDYYSLLGVAKDAGADELKAAYKALARKLHPDVSKDPKAGEKFRELNSVYDVLSDPRKRALYDKLGQVGSSSTRATKDGEDVQVWMNASLKTAVVGGRQLATFRPMCTCKGCGGSGARPGARTQECWACRGSGEVMRDVVVGDGGAAMPVEGECPACGGVGRQVCEFCLACGGVGRVAQERQIPINVPPGVSHGTCLKVKGQGDAGVKGGRSGDLYVFVCLEDDLDLRRDGVDLHSDVEVTFIEAMLGVTVRVETVHGSTAVIDLPGGTQHGHSVELPLCGLPPPRGSPEGADAGSHWVTVRLVVPEAEVGVSVREEEILRRLHALHVEKGSYEDEWRDAVY